MTAELLPEDLLYAENGHASDVVLTCLADGEKAIVPPPLVAHVLACPTCHRHLGNAALLSLRAGEEIAASAAAEREAEAALAPSPWRALALGFLVVFLGAIPRLASLPAKTLSFGRSATEIAPSIVRALGHGFDAIGPSALGPRVVASLAAALVLVGFAAFVARRATRAEAS